MTIYDVMYALGATGALAYTYTWVHDSAEARYKARELRRLEDLAHDLGAVTGSDIYWHDEPEPHTMEEATAAALQSAATSPEVAERWDLIFRFQVGRREGWRQALQSDVDMTDLDAEFGTILRDQGEAA